MRWEKLQAFIKRQHDAIPFVFVISLCFVLGLGGYYGWTRYFILTSATTNGTVIDRWTTTSMSKGKTSSNTTVKYRFYVEGKEYTFNESESFPAQEQGKEYPVYYDPANPSNATDGRRGGTLTVLVIALLTMLTTILIALRNR